MNYKNLFNKDSIKNSLNDLILNDETKYINGVSFIEALINIFFLIPFIFILILSYINIEKIISEINYLKNFEYILIGLIIAICFLELIILIRNVSYRITNVTGNTNSFGAFIIFLFFWYVALIAFFIPGKGTNNKLVINKKIGNDIDNINEFFQEGTYLTTNRFILANLVLLSIVILLTYYGVNQYYNLIIFPLIILILYKKFEFINIQTLFIFGYAILIIYYIISKSLF